MLEQTLSITLPEQARLEAHAAWEKFDHATSPHLNLLETSADLPEIETLAARIRRDFRALVVIGTGGSSLGGKTLCALHKNTFATHFLENVDPDETERLLASLNLAQTFFLFVSKSGGTLETLSQMLVVLGRLKPETIAKQCAAISDAKPSALRQICDSLGIPVLEHPAEIGGRYAIFSAVGLLPAAVVGLDIAALRAGAKAYVATQSAQIIEAVALQITLLEQRLPMHVLMPYVERLQSFTDWHRQLWAESIGKNGKGSTPVRAIGAIDQHSQIQLYLAGPRDKFFTFIAMPQKGKGPAVWPATLPISAHADIALLKGKTMGDIMDAEQWATIETFKAKGVPLRVLTIQQTDERTLGALLIHFMLETILSAQAIGVNPFDQPAVEDGKILARKMLGT